MHIFTTVILLWLSCMQDPAFLEHLVAVFFGLIESPKAVNCASAASMLKLFLHKVCSKFNVHLQAITEKVYGGMVSPVVLIRICNMFTTMQGVICSSYSCRQMAVRQVANPILIAHFQIAFHYYEG